jgi:cobalt-zinc-cadmium efflux system outer membrane protein
MMNAILSALRQHRQAWPASEMWKHVPRPPLSVFPALLLGFFTVYSCLGQVSAPTPPLTWRETQEHFRSNNSTLLAGQVSIEEARAQEISAFLRPNPDLTLGWDQINPFTSNPYQPLSQSYVYGSFSYLHERERKRELRLTSAKGATAIAISTQSDLERNLMFNLRDSFVRVLQAKAIVALTKESLDYYDKVLTINQDRYNAGGIARVDFQRLELQRLQYLSDLQTAQVNLRTAKIDLLQLLRDRSPVEQFDVAENFDYAEPQLRLEDLRNEALSTRPDLKEAQQTLAKAKTDHQLAVADGSADPTFGVDVSHQPTPLNTYVGFNISIPLRIFDKNQGEKLRTSLDIGRAQKLQDAAETVALHDVDAAYATLESTLNLLRPYKVKYLKEAEEIRSTIEYSYQHGAASLLDFLDAQNQYRTTRLSFLNLVGAYFSAANQVNFAVGHEVIQ